MAKKSKHRIKTARQALMLFLTQVIFMFLIVAFVHIVLADAFEFVPIESTTFSVSLGVMLTGMIVIDFMKQLATISRKNKKKAKKKQKRH